MEWFDLLLIMAVAVPCGAVAQMTSAHSKGGWFLHIGLAFMGGFLGVWFARSTGVPTVYDFKMASYSFPVIWALIGATFMVAAIGLIIKPRTR